MLLVEHALNVHKNYHIHHHTKLPITLSYDVPPNFSPTQMCLSKFSVKTNDELKQPLNFDSIDKSLWNDKCDYVDPQKAKNLNPSGLNLVVLQLNIRSILSHITELKRLLHILETKNSRVDIILLCETFLNKTTEKLVKIPGYTLICNSRTEMILIIKEEKTLKSSKKSVLNQP